MNMTSKELGYLGEKIVSLYLEKKGYRILCRNYCIKGGEIDIIAEIDGIIAFVEVKTRNPDSMSSGFEAITKLKKKLIVKTAIEYSYRNPHNFQPRFDVANVVLENNKVVDFNYIENAFDSTGLNIIM